MAISATPIDLAFPDSPGEEPLELRIALGPCRVRIAPGRGPLWVSGRYNAVVYAISTRTGKLLAEIPVGQGPHGLCVWPQPGRYSLGHTGVLR